VFGRGTNPLTDREIQRKKMSYLEEMVRVGNSDWVDPLDHKKGILASEILRFGECGEYAEKVEKADLLKLSLAPTDGDGARYQLPSDPAWKEAHLPPRRSLQTRAYMTLKAWRTQFEKQEAV
jgi:hypothetical protein